MPTTSSEAPSGSEPEEQAASPSVRTTAAGIFEVRIFVPEESRGTTTAPEKQIIGIQYVDKINANPNSEAWQAPSSARHGDYCRVHSQPPESSRATSPSATTTVPGPSMLLLEMMSSSSPDRPDSRA